MFWPLLSVLFFSWTCLAAEPKEIWSLAVDAPVAVYFDASSGFLYASVKDGKDARLDKVSLDGKLEKKGFVYGKGNPGTLRAYDGQLFWIAGKTVQVVNAKGGTRPLSHVPQDRDQPTDLAVSRDGSVFLGFSSGSIFRITQSGAALVSQGKAPAGLLVLEDKLHILRGGDLESASISGDEASTEKLCDCVGLERSSRGTWLTTGKEGTVVLDRNNVLTLKTELGRPAYVYRMDPNEDFFVLPLPKEGMLRAYRMPVIVKAKKTDK